MRTSIISSLAAAALVLSACGGGDARSDLVDELIKDAEEAGLVLDNSCVHQAAKDISEEDLKKMADSGPAGDAELSPEGAALAVDLFNCVDGNSLVDSFIADLGDSVDADCARDALKDINTTDLASGNVPEALFECISVDG